MISKHTIPIFVFLMVSSAVTHGDTLREGARALFKEGNTLYSKRDYNGALDKYLKARALFFNYRIDLNIANTLDSLKRYAEAAGEYERFLQQADKDAPQAIVHKARARLEQLKKEVASLKLTCGVKGAVIQVDNKASGKTPADIRFYLGPGEHEVVLSLANHEPFRWHGRLEAGEHRSLDLKSWIASLSRIEPVKPAEKASGGGPAKTRPPKKETPPAEQTTDAAQREVISPVPPQKSDSLLIQQRRSKTIWAWTSLGAGLACAMASGVLYGVGFVQRGDAYDRYSAAHDQALIDQHWGDVESAENLLIGGHVMAGVAAVAVGLSLYQFITRPPAPEALDPARSSVVVGVSGGQSGVGLSLSGVF